MSAFVLLIGGAGFVGLLVWFVVHVQKQEHEALGRAFHAVAAATGGSFDPGSHTFIGHRYPVVTLERDGAQVVLDLYTVNHGKSQSSYTRVRATYALGEGPKLHVRLERMLHGIGKAFGMQDLAIGDPEFDRAYMVAGPGAAAVRRVLGDGDRRQMRTMLREWTLRSSEREIELKRSGHCKLSEELIAAVEVALGAALAEKKLLDSLAAAIPDARTGSDGRTVTMTLRGVEGTFRLGDQSCTLAAPCPSGDPPFATRCDAPDSLPEGTLEPTTLALLSRVGEAKLSREKSTARVSWQDTPGPEQVEAAWQVLVALAAPSTSVGAFR